MFSNNDSLQTVTVPKNIITMGEGVFDNCSTLASLTLPFIGATRSYNTEDTNTFGYIFGKVEPEDSTNFYSVEQNGNTYYLPKRLITVSITDDTRLRSNGFINASFIKNIVLPEDYTDVEHGNQSVKFTEIGDYAFANMTALVSVKYQGQTETVNMITDTVAVIGEGAFYNATSLTQITLPSDLEELGER